MTGLPERMDEELAARLRARDADGVLDLLARWILAERVHVGEEALNRLIGAAGMARGGLGEPRGPGYRPN